MLALFHAVNLLVHVGPGWTVWGMFSWGPAMEEGDRIMAYWLLTLPPSLVHVSPDITSLGQDKLLPWHSRASVVRQLPRLMAGLMTHK